MSLRVSMSSFDTSAHGVAGDRMAVAAICLAGLYFVSSAFGQALKPIEPGDFFAVTGGNEIWRLPAGDTTGVGETYTRPPASGSLWSVSTDRDLPVRLCRRSGQ
jgi:hypothetical protein